MIDLISKSVDFTQDEADHLDNVKWSIFSLICLRTTPIDIKNKQKWSVLFCEKLILLNIKSINLMFKWNIYYAYR